jgi:hypothetical protein
VSEDNLGQADKTIADIGEKALIARYVRPIFNPSGDPWGVGDDCALVQAIKSPPFKRRAGATTLDAQRHCARDSAWIGTMPSFIQCTYGGYHSTGGPLPPSHSKRAK